MKYEQKSWRLYLVYFVDGGCSLAIFQVILETKEEETIRKEVSLLVNLRVEKIGDRQLWRIGIDHKVPFQPSVLTIFIVWLHKFFVNRVE